MGAPGDQHEARRQMLDTLAVLAGFEVEATFPRFRPDVHRRRSSDGAWFVGEAKATEGPDDSHAVDRLRQYVAVCQAPGSSVLLALCAPIADAAGWRNALATVSGMTTPVRRTAFGQSILLWCWYSAADGQSRSSGHSEHFGLNGRHSSRPC